MTMMNNLPIDLVEEILSRIPLTSLRRIQLTCKKWNTLSKDESLTKKLCAQQGEFLAIVLMHSSLFLMSVNHHNNSDPYLKSIGKLISLNDSDQLDMSHVCHCDGLLLCTTLGYTRLMVWNPYTGQTRRICVENTYFHNFQFVHYHTFGYDKNHTFKILRYVQGQSVREIYELSSNSCSWRVLDDITLDWEIDYNSRGLSLKGNIYWFAHDIESPGDVPDFLLCFDFTKERFGPRLPLPFESYYNDAVALASVGDEQLAVLFHRCDTCELEVWVTTKIEPNAVSWSKLLVVDLKPLTGFGFCPGGSFLVDKERRVVVLFHNAKYSVLPSFYVAYMMGQNGYYKEVVLGKRARIFYGYLLACSYVPSSVQINHPA